MKYDKAVFVISDDVRCVGASYEAAEDAELKLFKTFDQSIKEGDYVVVPTNTRHKMTVCQVREVDIELDLDSDDEVKWIIGTVSTVDFDELKAQEDDAIIRIKSAEKRRKREALLLSAALETEGAEAATELFEQHKRDAKNAIGFSDNYSEALQARLDTIRTQALDRFDAGPNSDAIADATMQRIHTRSQVQAIQHEHNRRAGEHIAEFQQNAGGLNRLLINDPSVDNFKRQIDAFNKSLEGIEGFLADVGDDIKLIGFAGQKAAK